MNTSVTVVPVISTKKEKRVLVYNIVMVDYSNRMGTRITLVSTSKVILFGNDEMQIVTLKNTFKLHESKHLFK